jgi:acyl-CoA synthetase (AMP-forming)/AMP-acid ligase II
MDASPETHRIDELLRRTAARFPARPALETRDRTLTYRELEACVDATCDDLHGLGVRSGQRVLVVGANSVYEVALLFALCRIGAWPVLVSGRVAPAQLDAVIAHSEPHLVLYVCAQLEVLDLGVRRGAVWTPFQELEEIRVCVRSLRSAPEAKAAQARDDVAAMIYTSGTTSAPKAAMLSHANLLFIALTQQQLRRYTENDKTYCALPLAHIGALGILLCVVAAGACLHLMPRFVPSELAMAIRRDGVTVVPGLPPLHVKFLDWVAANPAKFERGRVRLVTTSSSPLHVPVKRAVEALYGCPLQNAYGLTEASGVVFQMDVDQLRDDTSAGRTIPGVSVRIAGPDGAVLPAGVSGEILVRGPNVFLGYYRNPEANRTAFTADGWLRSGDIGRLDDTGLAFIEGRRQEAIRRSGYTVYPAEIEGALNAHPAVALSAVVPGRRAVDQEVAAFVELKREASVAADALIAFLRERVAPYELPGVVRVVDRLPTLTNGKIDRRTLRSWAGV